MIPGRVRELGAKCGASCSEFASRFSRCRTCREVIARCGAHSDRRFAHVCPEVKSESAA